MALTTALQARDISHAYGEGARSSTVLRGVSLDARRAEVLLLMGPSGSGKSTLLAVLAGLLRPQSGTVLAGGRDLWQQPEASREQFRRQEVGFVFQGCNLFAGLAVRQQLEMVLRWGAGAPAAEARRRTEQMLSRLGLAGKGGMFPAQLSGGEQQRVAVGRALLKAPSLCLADEPTSALDWEHGRQVLELLRGAARGQGTAVVVVSHDPRAVPYADRVVYLNEGRLTEPAAGSTLPA